MSDAYTIKMPQLSDTMTEGVVVSWEKQPGDAVKRGDIVATVETDKAIMDVEVFRDGFLSGPMAEVGETVAVNAGMAFLVSSADQVGAMGADTGAAESVAEDASQSSAVPEGQGEAIKMPQLSDTMTEGVVVSWEKQLGDEIKRGDIVAQIETDKAIMDVEVFRAGFLSGPMIEEGGVVPVGGAIAWLVQDAADLSVDTHSGGTAASASGTVSVVPVAVSDMRTAAGQKSVQGGKPVPRPEQGHASPYARQLAGSRGVSLQGIQGSGPQGSIVARDVLQAGAALPVPVPSMPEIQVPGAGRPMNAMEKAIAQSMTASLTLPTFHVSIHADPAAMMVAAKQQGVSVTVAIAKACALAIAKCPIMNAAYQPVDNIVERAQVDIGMAVAADGGGLVVPVLRDVGNAELEDLGKAWKGLLGRARTRRLAPEEYANPTFMVSNMGMFGVSYFDAIPTPGTAAILAIAANNAQGMPLTITADHRVVNGADVAVFLNVLKGIIEQPGSWLGNAGPAIPEGDWDYDVVVIGGGPGGEDCARDLVGHGMKVAMINDAPLPGGECLWRGCIPSKTWRGAADRLRDRAHDAHLGVQGTTAGDLDWDVLQASRERILKERGRMALNTDKGVKIDVIQGFARFASEHSVLVDSAGNVDDPFVRAEPGDGSAGRRISFGAAVIATGAPPFVPPIPGAYEGLAQGSVLTSDTVWNLQQKPESLVVIGGGAIGVEMAQIFQDFGSQVTLLEGQPRILAEVEDEVAKQLTAVLNDDPNLTIHAAAQVQAIEGAPGDVRVRYAAAGQEHSLSCDYVIMATGKRPVLDSLGLDKAGVDTADHVITVNARCQTSQPHIYAVGDVNGGLMLAHTAGQQGRVAADNLLGQRASYNQDVDCGVIFSRPQAAFVGLSQAQAKAKGMKVTEAKVPMKIDAKAMINHEDHGLIKLVVETQSERIVGVHFLADHADMLIGEAVLMVSAGMTLSQVAHAIHPHPTQTELFGELARRLHSRLRRSRKR